MKTAFSISLSAHLAVLLALTFALEQRSSFKTQIYLNQIQVGFIPYQKPLKKKSFSLKGQKNSPQGAVQTKDQNPPSTQGFKPSLGLNSNYLQQIRNQIDDNLDYPLSLRRRRIEGTVKLKFVISRNGSLLRADLQESSGIAELDSLALKAAYSAQPFPALPQNEFRESKKTGNIVLNLPVFFKLN